MSNNDLINRDLSVLWHPCSQMKDHEWLPMIPIRSAKGIWLKDFEDKQYLDAISSWWVNLFGHCNPHINQAIKQQLDELEHVILAGFSHEPAIKLAESLKDITPKGLDRCFYADNGSSAVEVAIKMSYHYWRNQGKAHKSKFITLSNSYHGETLGALAVGQVDLYKETYAPLLMDVLVAPSPDCFHRDEADSWSEHSQKQFLEIEKLLQKHAHETSAVIIEPLVQCAGNMRMYHPIYLKLLKDACLEYDVHLIADEIAVGFGRTGTLFACEQAQITPDFLCLSKGLTGGYLPLSVVMTTENIYQAFYDDYNNLKAFLHSHSYTGNPLACRAALATLDIFAQQDIIAKNEETSQTILRSVESMKDHPHVAEVRQTGMITAIEMVQNKANRLPYPWQQRRGLKVYEHGLKNGVLLRPLGSVVYFMPPYIINKEQIAHMVEIAIQGIEVATQE